MDSALIPVGVSRCSLPKFIAGLVVPALFLVWGLFATLLCWIKGLNQTAMNDYYGFALWIWADLAIIALGGGAFFSGLLKYVIGKDELKNIINYAVVIGFCCYTSALLILGIDVGQPLTRGWYIFWHANVHSMLTEVAFCLTCYLGVLTIEYLPLVLENRQIDRVKFFHFLSHNMHGAMAVFAATGAFLSFFHQGSLGGVTGVLFGRPFSYREHILIWPYSFFLFTWSAAAFGPCFLLFLTWLTEKITRKKLVKDNVILLLAKIAGWMIFTYIIAKSIDTLYWMNSTVGEKGFTWDFLYKNNAFYGPWILFLEVIVCGWVPGLILIIKPLREKSGLRVTAFALGIIGVSINRWVLVLQTMAAPVMSFDKWALYIPSWQEVATTLMPIAMGVIIVMLSYRYLPIFPQESELNPVSKFNH